MELLDFVRDLANAFQAVDATQPRHKGFQAGIGPFGEAPAVGAALTELKLRSPARYSAAMVKRLPDLLIPGDWSLEFKIVRGLRRGRRLGRCRLVTMTPPAFRKSTF